MILYVNSNPCPCCPAGKKKIQFMVHNCLTVGFLSCFMLCDRGGLNSLDDLRDEQNHSDVREKLVYMYS